MPVPPFTHIIHLIHRFSNTVLIEHDLLIKLTRLVYAFYMILSKLDELPFSMYKMYKCIQ